MFSTTPRISTFTWRNISTALRDVRQRDQRWCGHDDGSAYGHALDQAQLHIAGAGRQISDQVIELAPAHAAKELLHHAVEHRAAPDEGLVARIEQAHRDYLHAVSLHGNDGLLVQHLGLLGGAEHDGDVGAVNVGIEQADRRA